MRTERKEVKAPGTLNTSLSPQTNKATPAMTGTGAGTLHGRVQDLTVLGTGFEATA